MCMDSAHLTVEALLVAAAARPKADATVERARASCLAAAMEIRLTATEENMVIVRGLKVEGDRKDFLSTNSCETLLWYHTLGTYDLLCVSFFHRRLLLLLYST